MDAPPPRLFVVYEPTVPHAIVIRRGPSKVAATFSWDVRTDEVMLGQMMKARLYEHSAVLAEDGSTWQYFALNGRWDDPVTKGAYMVTARPPYLKALKLEPHGDTFGAYGDVHPRLVRCGWTNTGLPSGDDPYVLERPFGAATLRLSDEPQWRFATIVDGEVNEQRTWTWADVVDGALVFASQGKLWRSRSLDDRGDPVDPQLIHDFTDTTFVAVAAPY